MPLGWDEVNSGVQFIFQGSLLDQAETGTLLEITILFGSLLSSLPYSLTGFSWVHFLNNTSFQ